MNEEEIKNVAISGDPISVEACRFTVDRPLAAELSFYFGSKEHAEASPLARRLFEIEGVTGVLISHDRLTVTKITPAPWPVIGKAVGAAIRAHLATGLPAIPDEIRARMLPAAEVLSRVRGVLEREINPAVASHGGVVRLIDVKENVVYIQMGGGCQGCGMADVTLKQGIEKAIRASVPEVGEILDVTDHASGRNPYYSPSKK